MSGAPPAGPRARLAFGPHTCCVCWTRHSQHQQPFSGHNSATNNRWAARQCCFCGHEVCAGCWVEDWPPSPSPEEKAKAEKEKREREEEEAVKRSWSRVKAEILKMKWEGLLDWGTRVE